VAKLTIKHVGIKAVYATVPSFVEKTSEYAYFSAEEAKMFEKTVGIKERRVASKTVTCSDLCFKAAIDLVRDFNCKEEIDLLLFVSQSPDYFLPATAAILQDKLGLSTNCMAFDVSLGCSGYVYGLMLAGQYLQNGSVKKVLLLAGDKSTVSTHIQDKAAYPLFGDAGTATLLEFDDSANDWYFDAGTDGGGANAIIIEAGHSRMPYQNDDSANSEASTDIVRSKKHLSIDGMAIFNFALKNVPHSINNTLELANMGIDKIDFFVLHQANQLITDSLRKKFSLPVDKFPSSIGKYGNTSSASIPLTLCSEIEQELLTKELQLLFCGFGVGFSWATVILTTKHVTTKLLTHD
jgi:3-oxoacyl-[acyl-carrier-protein] synthase-3